MPNGPLARALPNGRSHSVSPLARSIARMPPYGGCLHSSLVNARRQPALTLTAYGVPACGSPPPSAPPESTLPSSRGIQPSLSAFRSDEHTSELQSLMRISYAVFL